MHEFFKSPFFNFEFLRLLGMVPFEGGEIAEILDAAGKIKTSTRRAGTRRGQRRAARRSR